MWCGERGMDGNDEEGMMRREGEKQERKDEEVRL